MPELVTGRKISPMGEGRPGLTAYPTRAASLGGLAIARALPIRERRLVGSWCFLDRFGPVSFSSGMPMNVPPHPHIGLQTVSWLLEGEVVHTDSLGCEAAARPGAVNVMTAGRGIAHAEETPIVNSGRLHGVQLWVALPDAVRNMEPAFVHIAETPVAEGRGGEARVFAGRLAGAASPAPHHSPIVGAEMRVHAGETFDLELDERFEHALLLLSGDCGLEGFALEDGSLYYLGSRRACLTLSSRAGSRLLLIGGEPFTEPVLMWWNFVARTPEELMGARTAWEAGQHFGDVPGAHGERLAAPPPLTFARPNPAS